MSLLVLMLQFWERLGAGAHGGRQGRCDAPQGSARSHSFVHYDLDGDLYVDFTVAGLPI